VCVSVSECREKEEKEIEVVVFQLLFVVGKNKKNNTNELILILLSLFRACLIDSGLVWGREGEIFEIDKYSLSPVVFELFFLRNEMQ